MVRCLNLRVKVSNRNSTNYAYIYSHRPTFKVRSTFRDQLKILPQAIGHFAELGKMKIFVLFSMRILFLIDYVFGVPLARNYSRIHRNVNMSYYNYSSDEEDFSRQIIRYWSNFIKTGFVEICLFHIDFLFFNRDPNKDVSSEDENLIEWKLYTDDEHNYIYFQLNNIRNERNYFDTMYNFWLENFQIENKGNCPKMKIKKHVRSWMIFLFFLFFLLMIYFIWIYFQKKKRGHLLSSNRSPTALIPYPNRISA